MMNAENVKYYDIALSHINNSANGQLELKEVTKLCDGSEGLAEEIAEEFERRGLIMDLKKTRCREGASFILISKGKAQLLEERGGFQAEYEKLHPPKSNAEKLNDHFYKIVREERLMRIEDYPDEIHSMNDTLLKIGLIETTVSFFVPSKEGLLLSYSGKTVQDYIAESIKPMPQPTKVKVKGNFIQSSEFNNSPVSSTNTTNNTPTEENSKEDSKLKKWKIIGGIIGAIATIGTVVAKLL